MHRGHVVQGCSLRGACSLKRSLTGWGARMQSGDLSGALRDNTTLHSTDIAHLIKQASCLVGRINEGHDSAGLPAREKVRTRLPQHLLQPVTATQVVALSKRCRLPSDSQYAGWLLHWTATS